MVTAAHCITENSTPSDYSIRLGLHNRLKPENYSVLRQLSDILIHPDYDPNDYRENDIALIKLLVNINSN